AGKPIVVGPHMENFQEIADEFRGEGALVEVRTAGELGREVAALLADPARRESLGRAGRALVDRNRGALARTVDALAGLLGGLSCSLPLGRSTARGPPPASPPTGVAG